MQSFRFYVLKPGGALWLYTDRPGGLKVTHAKLNWMGLARRLSGPLLVKHAPRAASDLPNAASDQPRLMRGFSDT